MPPVLAQPSVATLPDAAISALLCLFHQYALHEPDKQPCQRLSQRIFVHLKALAKREDMPELLRQTCDEMSDDWLLVVNRQ